MSYLTRSLAGPLFDLLKQYPILAVTGPRQSGKTTLLRELFPEYRYVSLENTDNRTFATEDPVGFLKRFDQQVIFDEVQRAPVLFPYLQTLVDESRQMGQFILSGSQNFHLLSNITQSLAGRVALFKLLPFDAAELQLNHLPITDWRSWLVKGFYPAIEDRGIAPAVFYNNYLQTYLERDVSDLARVQDAKRFRNFLLLCAARVGQLLNYSSLASEAGLSLPTVKSWLALLERSYLIHLLPPYYENFNKRVVKSPKLYFYDTGLLCFLLGLRSPGDLDEYRQTGSLFENLVIANFLKQAHHQYTLTEYWFWRDHRQREIDLLSRLGGSFQTYEIKSTETVLPKLFRGLNHFESEVVRQPTQKTLIYGGDQPHDRTGAKVRAWWG
ncbi:MAG: ATP-binding protein [Bacteroidota bacterium]